MVKELESSHGNVKETDNKELISRKEVKDTPFTVVTTEEGSFGAMGRYRITEVGEAKEIEKELKRMTWNRMIQVAMLLIRDNDESKIKK